MNTKPVKEDWAKGIKNRLDSFLTPHESWLDDGVPAKKEAVDTAYELCLHAYDKNVITSTKGPRYIFAFATVPELDGGVTLLWIIQDDQFYWYYAMIKPDGTFDLLSDSDEEAVVFEKNNATYEEVLDFIENVPA